MAMAEFLTSNIRRAYPLAKSLPTATQGWQETLVDACIAYDGIPGVNDHISLLSIKRLGSLAVFKIGISNDNYTTVTVTPVNTPGFFTPEAFTGEHYRGILMVNGTQLYSMVQGINNNDEVAINMPFALRCVSWANNRVTAVSAYTPTACTTPVFNSSTAIPSKTITGGAVTLVAKDGVDLDTTTLNGETVLRISAVTAEADTTATDSGTDIIIRGDDCFSVETLPDVQVVDGVPEAVTDEDDIGKYGVIRITSKCKPCCQCSDYEGAVNALRPGSVTLTELQTMLGSIRTSYLTAKSGLETLKSSIQAVINSYNNVIATATAAVSGGIYTGSDASGSRNRMAVTLVIMNMTLKRTTVTLTAAGLAANGGYTLVKMNAQKAGSAKTLWAELPANDISLEPGDTLTVVTTYTKTGDSNTATKPDGMSVSFTAQIDDMTATTKTVTVT